MLHLKFEEPTSNTDISGKNKNGKYLLILKTSFSLKMSCVPILKMHDYNDYTTLFICPL